MASFENFSLRLLHSFYILLISFIIGALVHRLEAAPCDSTSNICLTPGCVKSAAEILNYLDEDVNPCDNFYKFACGGWFDKHPIPDDKSSVSSFTVVQNELDLKLRVLLEKKENGSETKIVRWLKDMYGSCMDLKSIEKSGIEPLQKVLNDLGGWPVVMGDQWNESEFNWMDALFILRNLGYSSNILIDTSITQDYKNNTVYIITVDSTSLGIPERSFYIEGLEDSTTAAYFNLMVKAASKLGANEEISKKEMMDVFEFETALAKFSLPKEEKRDYSSLYNKYTLPQLQDFAPQIDWTKYFSGILNIPISENESMIIRDTHFLKKFAEFIENSNKRTIANYLTWRVVYQSLHLRILPKDWRAMYLEFMTEVMGASQETPRWERCLGSVSESLGIALGSYYVKNHFTSESKNLALELVEYFKKEFIVMLGDLDWMDENTKVEAKEKAEAMTAHIGYPEEMLNDTLVLDHYKNLTITNGSYFENVLNARRWKSDYDISFLRKPGIRGEWTKHVPVTDVNAMYILYENVIEFPAAILQNIFFGKDRPNYLNFGGIGSIIGHEITHGFDDEGRQFDKEGNSRNWWDETADKLFQEKAKCIIYQYGNYTAENGQHLNGINTQGENIADNGGLKGAYLAYHSWVKEKGTEPKLPGLKYTPNQLFWINAANIWCDKRRPEILKFDLLSDPHSLDEFRVVGPMSNLKEFSEDFQCPLGSPMNPEKKCEVW